MIRINIEYWTRNNEYRTVGNWELRTVNYKLITQQVLSSSDARLSSSIPCCPGWCLHRRKSLRQFNIPCSICMIKANIEYRTQTSTHPTCFARPPSLRCREGCRTKGVTGWVNNQYSLFDMHKKINIEYWTRNNEYQSRLLYTLHHPGWSPTGRTNFSIQYSLFGISWLNQYRILNKE